MSPTPSNVPEKGEEIAVPFERILDARVLADVVPADALEREVEYL